MWERLKIRLKNEDNHSSPLHHVDVLFLNIHVDVLSYLNVYTIINLSNYLNLRQKYSTLTRIMV